jgi:hypothetical protein
MEANMDDQDRLLAAWGVTREEIGEELGSSYIQAHADAQRGYRELGEKLIQRGNDIAADLTARLRDAGFDGEIAFKTEKLRD